MIFDFFGELLFFKFSIQEISNTNNAQKWDGLQIYSLLIQFRSEHGWLRVARRLMVSKFNRKIVKLV